MWQDKIRQIIDNPKQALFWAVILGLIPIFHWLGLLLMIVISLRNGPRAGILLAIVLMIITGVELRFLSHLSLSEIEFQMLNPLGLWFFATILRRRRNWNHVFEVAIFLGVLVVVGVYGLFPRVALEWNLSLVQLLEQVMQTQSNLLSSVSEQELQKIILLFGQLGVGLRVMFFIGAMLTTLIVGRYVQAALYNPGGLKKEFYQWHLSALFGALLVILMLVPMIAHRAIWFSFVPIAMIPPICTGLSLLHYYTASFKYQWAILIVFYVVLPFFMQLLFIVALAGLLDSFFNFRVRFPYKGVSL